MTVRHFFGGKKNKFVEIWVQATKTPLFCTYFNHEVVISNVPPEFLLQDDYM